MQSTRILFANQLRGIAAMLVVFSHLAGVFLLMPELVAHTTGAPVHHIPAPSWTRLINNPYWNPGALGVALFFLISGLVIPFSLAQGRTSFVIARLMRIYPVYWVATAISLLVVYLSSSFWGRAFPYSAWQVLANATLFHEYLGAWSIDLVNWSLAVELMFYALAFLLRGTIQRGKVLPLYAVPVFVILVNLHAVHSKYVTGQAGYAFAWIGTFLPFLLIGVLFNYRIRGLMSPVRTAFHTLALFSGFLICWRYGVWSIAFEEIASNYLIALAIFSLMFLARRHFRPHKFIDWFATVSYPLYLLHSLIGYSLLKMLIVVCKFGFTAAFSVTLFVVLILAWMVSRTVEVWSVRSGHRISALLGQNGLRTKLEGGAASPA
ncbi:acyltransferase [Herbaspirillum sp. HC18]|nr:acyltransferase [Herbaspirillum sp. HC18]